MQQIPAWRKVHIIGGAGSGKTTLARRLSARLRAPAYDLDRVAYANGAGAKQGEADRRRDVRQIVAQPCWVTEGIYLWWVDDLLNAADVILWLDIPWRVAAWRIVRRHVVASLRGSNQHPGWRNLLRFVFATRRYYLRPTPVAPMDVCDDPAITRAATIRALAPYRDKLIRRRH